MEIRWERSYEVCCVAQKFSINRIAAKPPIEFQFMSCDLLRSPKMRCQRAKKWENQKNIKQLIQRCQVWPSENQLQALLLVNKLRARMRHSEGEAAKKTSVLWRIQIQKEGKGRGQSMHYIIEVATLPEGFFETNRKKFE